MLTLWLILKHKPTPKQLYKLLYISLVKILVQCRKGKIYSLWVSGWFKKLILKWFLKRSEKLEMGLKGLLKSKSE